MTLARRLSTALALASLVAVFWLWQATPAAAHPLGNFTVNRYSRLEVSREQVRVRYALDVAEIPTFQAMPLLDRDGNGLIGEAEKTAYAAQQFAEIARGLVLTLDGVRVPLQPGETTLELLPGQGGLPTLRLSAWLEAPAGGALLARAWQRDGSVRLEYHDNNAPQRIGWREALVQVTPPDGLAVVGIGGAPVPTQDVSNELRAYPDDLLSSPLDVRTLNLSLTLAPAIPSQGARGQARSDTAGAAVAIGPSLARSPDQLVALVTSVTLTPLMVLVALFTAMVLGGMHALSPGHGKTIVGAYLVGSRGTAGHALFLGLTVTVVHTAGVFALLLVTLFASHYVLPEQIFPWMSLISGALVLAIGIALVQARWRSARLAQVVAGRWSPDHEHQEHDEHHEHDDHHPHVHHADASVGHADSAVVGKPVLSLPKDRSSFVLRPPRSSVVGRSSALAHSHSLGSHTHVLPAAGGTPVTWRSLLMLGISGGLLPCPSALVLGLGSIALNRTLYGLVLIAAFSAGLAATLVAIGLLMVYSTRAAGRLRLPARFSRAGRLPDGVRWLPVASAGVVALAGLALTWEAARTLGLGEVWAAVRAGALDVALDVAHASRAAQHVGGLAVLAAALALGLRHGIDWDHLAAIGDITSAARLRPMWLALLYALGHALVVVVLGLAALHFQAILPEWVDSVMERVVGATLVLLGGWVVYSLVRAWRGNGEFRLQSRWMLALAGVRRGWRYLQAKLHGHAHDGRSHVHRVDQYGPKTAFGTGVIHGIGAETGTQVLLIAAVGGAASPGWGTAMLLAFVAGLVLSNTAVALLASAGFVSAGRANHTNRTGIANRANWPKTVYLAAGCAAAVLSLYVGGHALLGLSDRLPDLQAMLTLDT